MNPRIQAGLFAVLFVVAAAAQDPPPGPPGGRPGAGGPPRGGPPPMRQELELKKKFDKNGDGKLDSAERGQARAAARAERARERDRRPGGGPRRGPPGEDREPPKRGPTISKADVKPVAPSVPLYEPSALRTFFFDFENADWEDELGDFMYTDVEVPATLTVDGKAYARVGVSFRGASSLFTVDAGYKRSLNVRVDAEEAGQAVLGYRNLNLLNGHADPSFLKAFLASHITRAYLPAPKVNHVRVVVNGEFWGVYVNAQQLDRTFLGEHFPDTEGARWKAPGSPRGRAGLEYFGADKAEYERWFELKSGGKAAWKDLIALCEALNQTPLDQLEARLGPVLDIDGVLRFLAVECVLANDDGYWTRASDYNIFRDKHGRFHIFPHDMNECFASGGGGPGPGGSLRGGPTLDPLVAVDDAKKPLRNRLLAVPALRDRYLRYVRDIAGTALDWRTLGPVVAKQRKLIEDAVEADTRKLGSIEAFRRMTADEPGRAPDRQPGGRPPALSLRQFADQRRKFLLEHAAIKAIVDPPPSTGAPR